jgi:hypothetical protein
MTPKGQQVFIERQSPLKTKMAPEPGLQIGGPSLVRPKSLPYL